MSIQMAVSTRNARANAIEAEIGASAIMEIRTGAPPANVAAADSGTLLCPITLPADWLTAASNGVVSKNGTWQGTAVAAGVAGHYRIKTSGGVARLQGTCGQGSGDASLNNTNIAVGQVVTVDTYDLNEPNA